MNLILHCTVMIYQSKYENGEPQVKQVDIDYVVENQKVILS